MPIDRSSPSSKISRKTLIVIHVHVLEVVPLLMVKLSTCKSDVLLILTNKLSLHGSMLRTGDEIFPLNPW